MSLDTVNVKGNLKQKAKYRCSEPGRMSSEMEGTRRRQERHPGSNTEGGSHSQLQQCRGQPLPGPEGVCPLLLALGTSPASQEK